MRVRPDFVVLTLTLAAATACGGTSPTSPAPPSSSPPAALRIVGDEVIDLTPGESRALTVQELSGFAYVTRPAANYAWTSSDAAVASVSASGVVTPGTGLGQAVITATAPDGQTAVARLWIQLPESVPSTFRITLLFSENFPADWKPHFEWAAARWEQVIRAPLPAAPLVNPPSNVCGNTPGAPPIPALSGTTTGTVILVERSTTNGTGAFGGPCTQRPLPSPTVIFGRVTIEQADDGGLANRPVALHEIGHALGLVGLIQGPQPYWFDFRTNRYTGPYALEGHRRQFGTTPVFLNTPAAHWAFAPDVMNGNSILITPVTVGALMDMNYPAAWYSADRR